VRESFRRHKAGLANYDLVVLCRNKAALASKKQLAVSIQTHWMKLIVDE
jgi:RNase P protein component